MKSKKLVLFLGVFSIFFYSFGQPDKSVAKPGVLQAGIAKIDITPDIPVMLYGYASRKSLSEAIHDRL